MYTFDTETTANKLQGRAATGLTTPMELLGAHPGVSVIDPSSVLTRLWYFDGKFLRAEGFRLDQEYVRSLVALSNQAVGAGLVHGFDVRLGSSDTFRVGGGLGLAPSGRVVYLPADTDLNIAQLISRSFGEFDPGAASEGGTAEFSPCPPDAPKDLEPGVPPRPLYVLTVAATEALCGEEERFGKLCEDACATDSDRSVAVEGVRFRVRELRLRLPTSRTVPFTGAHLRSRVAAAFYDAERHAVPSMISGAGLRTAVWCAGADAIGGEEIPLAVFDRAGQVTSFVDQWTARRELVESSPQRYWQWRFAARPLDVFLAQVLQFQCQLIGFGAGDGSPVGDPCADERAALQEVGQVLGTLAGPPPAEGGFLAAKLSTNEVAGVEAIGTIGDALRARLGELRTLVAGALTGRRSATGSVLIDLGVVETPSAGYLPVDPAHDVQPQVRAFMGAGVDLRFCAVRPDFVPEAFQEAQHMERISLTRGLDDPDDVEEVDVLVPGGTFEPRPAPTGAFEGVLRVLPSELRSEARTATGAALALQAVARDQVTDGWSWTLAASGEGPDEAAVQNLASAMAGDAGLIDPSTRAVRVDISEDEAHAASLSDAAAGLRRNREAASARARSDRIVSATAAGASAMIDDLPLKAGDRRPIALWLDVETADALDDVVVGGRTAVRVRASLYSRAGKSPVFFDVQIHGNAIVVARQPVAGGSDVIITTQVEGTADPLVVVGGKAADNKPAPVSGLELLWRVAVAPSGARIVSVTARRGQTASLGAEFTDAGSPRHVEGVLGLLRSFRSKLDTGAWKSIVDVSAAGTESRRLADLALDEAAGALDAGSPGRDLGNSVIDVIAGELEARQRASGFKVFARRRLFPEAEDSTGVVKARTDWVMFHRRRTKRCGTPDTPTPVAVRTFRWHHAVRPAGKDDVARLGRLGGSWQKVGGQADGAFAKTWDRLDALGFEPVTVVEFLEDATDLHSSTGALRAAWSAATRGERMTEAMIATQGVGDGESVNLGRLHSATGAVGDLIDVSQLKTRAITDVPPDFQADGIDGVIFSIGTAPAEVELDCAHVFRMDTDAFGRLTAALPNLGTLDQVSEFLKEFGAPEPIVAQYEGDTIANADAVKQWSSGNTIEVVAIVVDQSVAGDAAVRDQWTGPRTDALGELLGFSSSFTPDGADLDLGDCEAVYFVAEVPPG